MRGLSWVIITVAIIIAVAYIYAISPAQTAPPKTEELYTYISHLEAIKLIPVSGMKIVPYLMVEGPKYVTPKAAEEGEISKDLPFVQ
jgi:hypothetical protein